MKFWLSRGANANALDLAGRTPLMAACRGSHTQNVERLFSSPRRRRHDDDDDDEDDDQEGVNLNWMYDWCKYSCSRVVPTFRSVTNKGIRRFKWQRAKDLLPLLTICCNKMGPCGVSSDYPFLFLRFAVLLVFGSLVRYFIFKFCGENDESCVCYALYSSSLSQRCRGVSTTTTTTTLELTVNNVEAVQHLDIRW